MRSATSAAFRGQPLQGDGAEFVHEYLQRKTLSQIGYRFDLDGMSCFKADCFGIIANQIADLEKKEIDRIKNKAKNG